MFSYQVYLRYLVYNGQRSLILYKKRGKSYRFSVNKKESVMKIRSGFVSNSSTSSFCILGIVLNDGEWDDELDYLSNDLIHIEYGISDYDDYLLGAPPKSMKDNETLIQFKTRVASEISSVLDRNVTADELNWHNDFHQVLL